MKQKLRKALTVVLALVLVVSLAAVLRQQMGYRQGDEDYSAAEELAGVSQEVVSRSQPKKEPASAPEQEETPAAEEEADPEAELLEALAATDLAALREVNTDVVGWITIPGTKVNYPVVHRGDNDYYLDHTWKGERSSVGAIFLDYRNSPDLTDDNTLIYGHNMKNRSMFGELKYYVNDGHWEEHPSIYIVDDNGVRRYDIYAVYEASVDAVTYEKTFADAAAKEAFINYGIRRTVVDTGVVPTAEDDIITLSTCTGVGYATRWVVQAALAEAE